MTVDLAHLVALAGAVKERQKVKPQAAHKPWRIVNATSDTEATVYIYDDIGQDMWGDGISAMDFTNELAAITAPVMNVRFNSNGGQVFEGVTMYEAIKRHPSQSVGWVDGIAASAASFILMACDIVVMAKTSRLMIHDAGTGGIYIQGNARQIREAAKEVETFADQLDSLSDTIAQIYVDKAGGTVKAWRAEMETDRWYTAEEAKTVGLTDYIDELPATEPAPTPENKLSTFDVEGMRNMLKGAFA